MCNVLGIFVQGHMPIMRSVCVQLFLVNIVNCTDSYEAYILTCMSDIWT